MNNYSWMQQKIHELALSSRFMRMMTFDIESSLIKANQINDNNIFVMGLARSGTTILLNALYKSNIFASLSYKDMPFVLAPNLWSKLSFNKKKDFDFVQRAHGDGIKITQDSPEAFEEVFWMTFDDDEDCEEKFKKYLQIIMHRYQKKRYLSKNNQNIRRIEFISKIFPKSKILISFRNPLQHAYSLLIQHQRFIEHSRKDIFISKYMKWIGHTEFGPNYIPISNKNLNFRDDLNINHWLEQWYFTYKNCYEVFKKKENVKFICYEHLCSSKKYWLDILQILNIKKSYDFEFKESLKNVSVEIDNVIMDKVLSLYVDMSKLKLHY